MKVLVGVLCVALVIVGVSSNPVDHQKDHHRVARQAPPLPIPDAPIPKELPKPGVSDAGNVVSSGNKAKETANSAKTEIDDKMPDPKDDIMKVPEKCMPNGSETNPGSKATECMKANMEVGRTFMEMPEKGAEIMLDAGKKMIPGGR